MYKIRFTSASDPELYLDYVGPIQDALDDHYERWMDVPDTWNISMVIILEPTTPYMEGDTVSTGTPRDNGRGYVYRIREELVLIRYRGIDFKEWLHHSEVTIRAKRVNDIDP